MNSNSTTLASNTAPLTSAPLSRTHTDSPGDHNGEIRQALDQSFSETFRFLLGALMGMYAVFVTIDLVSIAEQPEYRPLVLVDAAMLAGFGLGLALYRNDPRWHRRAHPLATLYVGLMLANHFFSVYTVRDPQYANDLAILMIGVGCLFLSTLWLLIAAAMVLLTWAAMLQWTPDLAISSYMFASSSAVATFAHVARMRTMRRLERLRLDECRHNEELQAALRAAEREIEARRRAEAEQERLETELVQAHKMEAIGTLAGGVAHDFNNLLTGILGYANLLKLDLTPGDSSYEAADVIEKAAERGSLLTRQLLGFARKGKQQAVELDLRSLAHEVALLLHRTLDRKILIEEDYQDQPSTVLGDPSQLHQVILNLAVNARDAMEDGGTLTLRTRIVPHAASDDALPGVPHVPGPFVRLTVSDTGPGVPASVRDRIFEPFFTTKPQGKGTGMGLATAYGIVRNHGGRIQLENREEGGATFSVDLPWAEAAAVTELKDPAGSPRDSAAGRILVIDDEEMVRRLARAMLTKLGYEVVLAADGAEAIEIYRQRPLDFDLVLLDMIMPKMDGHECFLQLKAINPGVRAVLSSGFSQEGTAQRILDDGVKGFVQKPYRLQEIAEALNQALGKS